jgi:hypothetical protein
VATAADGTRFVRDSKNPDGPVLTYIREEWEEHPRRPEVLTEHSNAPRTSPGVRCGAVRRFVFKPRLVFERVLADQSATWSVVA